MRAAILCLLLSAVAISADLQSDIDDVLGHLPMKQIEAITRKHIAANPNIRSALENLQNIGDEQIYNDVVSKVGNLMKFLKNRGIDGESLLRHMIKISLDFHRKLLEQPSSDEDESSSVSISGDLTADVLKVLAASDILKVIEEKTKTSPEFAHFVAVVRDPEFRNLFFRGVHTTAFAVAGGDSSADLQSAIDEVLGHLPMKQIEAITRKHIAANPNIRSALENLQKIGDEQIYNDVVSKVGNLMKFLKNRGIDGESLLRHMIKISLDFHRKLLEQPSSDEDESSSVSISGDLTADVLKVLAASDILKVIEEKTKTSPEFAHFVAVVRDPEFRNLFFRGVHTTAFAVVGGDSSADLIADIDDVVSHLPMKQMEALARKYIAANPKIRSSLEYLQKVGEEKLYNDVVSKVGYLMKFLKNRDINGESILRHMIKLSLDFHRRLLEQQASDEDESSSVSISGDLTADALKVVRASDILKVIEEKAKVSPNFAHFVAVVRDPEFRALFLKGVNTRAIAIESRPPHARGGLRKVWQKIKDMGFGVGVSISLGK